jgi:hypothetical protein
MNVVEILNWFCPMREAEFNFGSGKPQASLS